MTAVLGVNDPPVRLLRLAFVSVVLGGLLAYLAWAGAAEWLGAGAAALAALTAAYIGIDLFWLAPRGESEAERHARGEARWEVPDEWLPPDDDREDEP